MIYDVAVIGAGPSGVSAALRCARQGLQTALCTDRPVLGGNSSSEIRVWTRGSTGAGNLFAEEMGTLGELKLKNLAANPTGNVYGWDDILLDAALAQPRLTLHLNLPITRVEKDGHRRITCVSGVQMGSGEAVRLQARMYIDCTGDGQVAYLAGVPFRMGREGRGVYGESMAGETGDSALLGSSILMQSKRENRPVPYRAPAYAYSLAEVEKLIERGGRIVTPDMQASDCWWFEFGGCLDTVKDNQRITLELRRIVLGIWNYIKNSGRFQAENLALEWMGTLPGKRESRRFTGAHTLIQQEIETNAFEGRSVAYGGWYMDAHPSQGIFSQEEHCTQLAVKCYGIPLSCFYHADFPNLMFAGRAASTSHQAFTSYRIMNTCALTGDACGVAAGLCLGQGLTPAELLAGGEEALARQMAREDVIFDTPPQGLDMACATVTADSEHPHTGAMLPGRLPLREQVYVCIPASGVAVRLRLQSDRACQVAYQLCSQAQPSRLAEEKVLAQGQWLLTPGVNEVEAELPQGEGFTMVWLADTPGVSLCQGESLCGAAAGTREGAEVVSPWLQWPGCYEAANLLGGYTRPYRGANGWMARGPQAKAEIRWESPVTLSALRLYLDPDFCAELTSSRGSIWSPHHIYQARERMPPHLVRHYTLWVDGEIVAQVRDNESRMPVHRFPPRQARRITLEIQDTYGGDAVVYRLLAE